MKCTNPTMKKLVSLYQFNLLTDEEKISVEAHLLECDSCFEELYRFSPIQEVLEEMPERFLDVLQPRKNLILRIIQLLKNQFESLKRTIVSIFSVFIRLWDRPITKILVPATVSVLLAVIFLLPHFLFQPTKYSDLAIIKKPPYERLKFKGSIELTPTQKLFDEAMKFYDDDKYSKAVQKLTAYLEREPDNAYGHFFLGISLLLNDSIEKGIKHFRIASELSKEQSNMFLLEKCRWNLGNACLKTNDADNALIEFRKIVELQGEFEKEADKQITRIEELKNEK